MATTHQMKYDLKFSTTKFTFNLSKQRREVNCLTRVCNTSRLDGEAGAHTIGVARCSSFKSRLTGVDPTLDSDFAKTLSKTCSAGDNAEQPFDATRNDFDNLYFNALIRKAGVLFSDQTLLTNAKTRAAVNGYAMNQAMFFLDFQQAMVKMGMVDVKEGGKGEVRHNCRKIN